MSCAQDRVRYASGPSALHQRTECATPVGRVLCARDRGAALELGDLRYSWVTYATVGRRRLPGRCRGLGQMHL